MTTSTTSQTGPAVLVTGGSSGLGAAVVDAVVKSGGRPFVIDRQPPRDGIPWVECDLADTRAAEAATRQLAEQAGGLDGVVTAAGMDVPGTLVDTPGDVWERIVTIDLLATAAVIRAAIPVLKQSHGTIVTIASTLGVKAVSDATAYCAAKFGVVGFTRALAAPAWLTPLIDLIGGVDRVVPVDGMQSRLPALPPVSLAVNLHGRGPQSHRLLAEAHPRRLWAFANVDAGHLDGPSWTEEEHEVTRWCRLVRHYGAPADEKELRLAVPSADVPQGVTIVHPGAKSPTRRWPADRFAAVAKNLTAQGHRVVVTGSAGERDVAVEVARAAGLPDSAVLAGRTGLGDLAALVAHARLLVSGDTGIGHLASAYRTPSVLLFGPMPPRRWGPPAGRDYHRAIWHGTRVDAGDALGPDPHPALQDIGVDEVLDAAGDVERARHAVAAQ